MTSSYPFRFQEVSPNAQYLGPLDLGHMRCIEVRFSEPYGLLQHQHSVSSQRSSKAPTCLLQQLIVPEVIKKNQYIYLKKRKYSQTFHKPIHHLWRFAYCDFAFYFPASAYATLNCSYIKKVYNQNFRSINYCHNVPLFLLQVACWISSPSFTAVCDEEKLYTIIWVQQQSN